MRLALLAALEKDAARRSGAGGDDGDGDELWGFGRTAVLACGAVVGAAAATLLLLAVRAGVRGGSGV
jgi:hypothetical protein